MKPSLIALCALIFLSHTALAQKAGMPSKPFPLGITAQIQSAAMGEKRILNIYLPDGYSPDSAATYPVIYLLDGSANEDFIHVTGVVQFLTMIEAMPKSIVVGVANVDRKRDFTFPTTIAKDKASYPTTGGSAKFITFLEQELQPYIRKSYKTNSSNTLIGQSLGGLLATEVLLRKPYLFDDYIIVSPSLWWDDESLLAKAPALLAKGASQKPIRACILVGAEGRQMEGDAKRLNELITASGQKNLHASFMPLPQENHLTILHNAVYKALQVLNPRVYEQAK